jgi:hypothetical protein
MQRSANVAQLLGVPRMCVALLTVAVVAGACGQPSNDGAAVVRDSAGIVIVESRRPAWSGAVGWQVAADPFLEGGYKVSGIPVP